MEQMIASDERVREMLRTTFGYDSFRPLQQEIVETILDRQDVFVLMPTGGGKSLCYQLPALLMNGLTVVVSPLIALMKDQVDSLQMLGVPATFINSSLDPSEIGRRQAAVARGEIKLLYVAPERLTNPGFLSLLANARISLFAIDEAHCISEWGHDFRPEYRELRRVRQQFPAIPFATFTATATTRVHQDIVKQLGLENAASFRGSFNRPNLFYEVRPKRDADRQLVEYLEHRGGGSGIVYCLSRKEVDDVAQMLRGAGFHAVAYHAGLSSNERRQRQEAFARDEADIVVATIAFGMGIDKPDVRFVVHYDMPKNLEGYYQESGRAGRDGDPSDCILFFAASDVAKHEYFIKQKSSEQERAVARDQLRKMADWAESAQCRRRALLAYFDEDFDSQPEPCCDACRSPVATTDSTVLALMFLSCVALTRERFGMTYVVDVLRGGSDERITRARHDQLATYGIGRDRPKEEWLQLARELIRVGYLRRDGEYGILKLTPQGSAVLANQDARVMLTMPERARPKERPSSHQGIVSTPETLGGTARGSLDLFLGGLDPLEIAEARHLALSTAEGHIAEAIETGTLTDIDRLVDAKTRRLIEQTVAELGQGTLMRPIKEHLGDDVTYGEIRYVLAAQHYESKSGLSRSASQGFRETGAAGRGDPDPHLFERLRNVRKQIADEREVPAYMVFHDSVLRQMSAERPATRPALLQIPGIGERKAEEFGDAFLREIAKYARETASGHNSAATR